MKLVKKKYKKSYVYTKGFKVYEVELTWDFFVKCLNDFMECFFYYKNEIIDIAFHFENDKKIYELNITSETNPRHFTFDTVEELINFKTFDNKSICDIWDDLEN